MGGHPLRQRVGSVDRLGGGRSLPAGDKASPTLWPVDDIAVDTGQSPSARSLSGYLSSARSSSHWLQSRRLFDRIFGRDCPRPGPAAAIAVDRLAPRTTRIKSSRLDVVRQPLTFRFSSDNRSSRLLPPRAAFRPGQITMLLMLLRRLLMAKVIVRLLLLKIFFHHNNTNSPGAEGGPVCNHMSPNFDSWSSRGLKRTKYK